MRTRVPPRRFHGAALFLGALLGALLIATLACAPAVRPQTTLVWLVGHREPRFDPTGPPDPVRWALQRLLGQGLVDEDDVGQITGASAQGWEVTRDGLTYSFRLRPGLTFASGRPCTSEEFRRAFGRGLNRIDHATYAWLLAPVVGVDRVRAGRPLPPLGITAPDEHTIVLRLARADSTLLSRLAVPGVATPWESDSSGGGWGGGAGPYRLVMREPGRRMVMARRSPGPGPDTIRVEFGFGATRARDPKTAPRSPDARA